MDAATSTATTGEEVTQEQVEELVDQLLRDHPPATTDRARFLGAQFDLGLAWVHFDVGAGGLGAAPGLQRIVQQRISEAGGPSAWGANPIGVGMAAPTLHAWGSAEQRAMLRPLFTAEEIWCQLFSEPGAGSDLAGLSTRAERDGDEWVVNGQKVWTSLGHLARWGLLVARTDPDVPKHRGLTYFVLDMQAPGVDVRPLRQMTGDAEFNEIYLTDVRVPDSARLGGVGDGWRVSLTTLMNERVSIGGQSSGGRGPVASALELWRALPADERDAVRRDQLVRLWVDDAVIRFTVQRGAQAQARGVPGPEGSIAKLASSELNQRAYAFCMTLLGPEATLYPGYDVDRFAREAQRDVRAAFLRSRANTIEGGTSEILRNILGERVLGLPGDIRVDKDLPWSQVPRS